MADVKILGAGLAGCEAALWLAEQGHTVDLYEQKPHAYSPAHKQQGFAELVCSNSLKSDRLDSAAGLLKEEMRRLGSHLLPIAAQCSVAAGGALAVDRNEFSRLVTEAVEQCPNITIHRQEVTEIAPHEGITLVATGPLTQGALADSINQLTGGQRLSFYDAAAPIVVGESLDMEKVFAASRWGKGDADYLNCPFDKEGYEAFYEALISAERAPLHDFDGDGEVTVYEGCMPVEIMAKRGPDTLRFGPLKPVGLTDPNTGRRPWANVQLRRENQEGTLFNLVGFQTNLKFGEQKRVFQMIPGLENAEFARYGVMHRNTFLNSPMLLNDTLNLKEYPNVYFAGQITGFEGYMESAACGLLAARAIHARLTQKPLQKLPTNCMTGALLHYITQENKDFQPIGANMGLLPSLETRIKDKRQRYAEIANRALEALEQAIHEN